MQFEVADAAAMARVGAQLATAVADAPAVVLLEGELGAGKTTLVRGLVRALGHSGPVRSPTYTLMEEYDSHGRKVLHLDLYRLADAEELEYLGLRDTLGDDQPAPLILVEWPQRGEGMLPAADLRLCITYHGQARRMVAQALSERGRAWCLALETAQGAERPE